MKIQAKKVTSATQIHVGKCYFIGMHTGNGRAYNMESGGTPADGNMVFDGDEWVASVVLPKPGVECSNGLYVSAACVVYWSLG